MSAAAAAANAAPTEAPKKKSKKLLFILIGVVVLALAGAGGALFILKKNTAEDGEHAEETVKPLDAKSAPVFLPLENMVVNLADPGGNRFAQVGLTLQLADAHTNDAVKAFMPSIRSQILVLISQRTSEELLQLQGKEKLASDIIATIAKTMSYPMPKPGQNKEKSSKENENPVQAVLFSSFIVQ